MKFWILLVGVACILGGILLVPTNIFFGICLIIIGIIILAIALTLQGIERSEWKALSEIPSETQNRIITKAKEFAGLITIQNAIYPKVTTSHTRFVNILGIDKDGAQVLVGIDPDTIEIIKMFKLCPRKIEEATEVMIPEERAKSSCFDFLKTKNLSLQDNYVLKEATTVSIGPRKRWRFVWRHIENDVLVNPDFLMMEVNATEAAEVISYSKVHHEISVDLASRLTPQEAEVSARGFMKNLKDYRLFESVLSVVYPNNFFNRQIWEWSERQVLCWILRFGKENHHLIEVWIDAINGEIHGGQLCHLPVPEVFGIDSPTNIPTHMQSHLNNIWNPYLAKMKFDVSSFDWTNAPSGIAENTISNAISNSRFFIVEGHGDVTPTAEKMIIAYQGADDVQSFTPDEVPPNNLRFVLLDTCMSGHDGSGLDFKDTFISQGADVFIGFDAYMCAWAYEDRLLHYLAQGLHLDNAHNLADAEVSPSYPITITFNTSCLNRIRLAPILVNISLSPTNSIGTGDTFTVTASINNREDVDFTTATNVQAMLILPFGFTIVSGANPQNIGSLNWSSIVTAVWTVRAPNLTGLYTLDVEVWSDNLGVAVTDPDDPYHKFTVDVYGHWHAFVLHLLYKILEIFRILPRYKRKPFYPEPSEYDYDVRTRRAI